MPPPFFVVGNDRSGTTMLRLVLDRGAVAIPPESMFLIDFAPVRERGGLGDARAAEDLLREVWNHPRVRHWDLPPEPPAVPRGLDHAEAYRFCVSAPFAAYAAARGKQRWGDKTPAYLRHLDELDTVWPDARFVILVRDGRDVALSVLRVPFGANNVWAAARWWADGIRLGRDAEQRLGDRVITVRYEDLVIEPQTYIPKICAFLELPFDPDMLALERVDDAVPAGQTWSLTHSGNGINTSAVGKWRREMTVEQRRIFAGVAGAELEALGYEVDEPSVALGGARAAAYAGHDAILRGVNFARLRLVQERGRELRYVLRRKLELR